jgi:hypothetical protein
MDPNAALTRLRELMWELECQLPGPDVLRTTPVEDAATEVLDQWQALDAWLSKGGFLPQAWDGNRG